MRILAASFAALLISCTGEGADTVRVSPGEVAEGGKADGFDGARVEVKVTVDASQIDAVRDDLGLDGDLAEERDVWFYDSDLSLFESGAVLRARKVSGRDDDSTVKIRPLDASAVDPSWFEVDGASSARPTGRRRPRCRPAR